MSFDTYIHFWNYHHNQENKHLKAPEFHQDSLIPHSLLSLLHPLSVPGSHWSIFTTWEFWEGLHMELQRCDMRMTARWCLEFTCGASELHLLSPSREENHVRELEDTLFNLQEIFQSNIISSYNSHSARICGKRKVL